MARPPGSPNRRVSQVEGICLKRGFSSIDAMIDGANIALQKFIEHSEKEEKGTISLMESQAAEYLKMYLKAAGDLAKFRYPMLKAIEHAKASPLDEMTPAQQLEAMKHMVSMLEHKVKSGPGTV